MTSGSNSHRVQLVGRSLITVAGVGLALLSFTAGPNGLARAQEKKQGKKEAGGEAKKGNSGERHEEGKPGEKSVVYNWTMGGPDVKYGTANVTLNPEGSWNFSGHVNDEPTNVKTKQYSLNGCGIFAIVFAVKSSEGTVIGFKHSAVLGKFDPQAYSWETQGTNRTIKDNYEAFARATNYLTHPQNRRILQSWKAKSPIFPTV